MSPPAVRTFLALGSNLGDRRRYLGQAVDSLPDVVAVSPVYETDPIGGPGGQDAYLNIVVELSTTIAPRALLSICHRIEANAERVRAERWGPRTLDVDIIWMDGVTMDDESLTIPHPRWKDRRFVLAPLRDLAPDLVSERELQLSDGIVRRVEDL
ncbi:2-amino-4-hydroxy-6-hydroxymethyldihydropteridine diphosphokinase [Dermatobacter hominis]|uniref:2-amino-4-hydroxy-6- hydroxymethyldihydropteridine diphosphokinase n=1 Tax=Dermatobacter hominis TaxID=2884263 RepID=UPI001D115935|nr:2-amino-4-hydroxy-6-hydroxymethyldihydropteridine diphosphokinase [Dermatobacter hominis]UDY34449.1 2-amino-4-hydroxy-6-hydroxymethyldihydropteridine diphosphokinase [Dermatobacter hominis]